MAYSKIKKILFVLLCIFIVLFPFWCVSGLCAETETVEGEVISNITYNPNTSNYFTASSSNLICFTIEPGYYYYFTNSSNGPRTLVTSNEKPVVNGSFEVLARVEQDETYSFIGNGYVFISSGSGAFTCTREKIPGMDSTISELVNNVGISSFWNIFDISINYIVIVVVFALGCFIIFKLIKKVSKGKEGF